MDAHIAPAQLRYRDTALGERSAGDQPHRHPRQVPSRAAMRHEPLI
jgi:hypothetical protein